jgi:hypothetical protein
VGQTCQVIIKLWQDFLDAHDSPWLSIPSPLAQP